MMYITYNNKMINKERSGEVKNKLKRKAGEREHYLYRKKKNAEKREKKRKEQLE